MMREIIREFDKTAVVFHYNKKHNEDQNIPPWVLKVNGYSFYVHHFDVEPGVGFSTKETPDNPHTKAALKFKGSCTIYEEDGKMYGLVR